ncbi:hypothetical protein AX769_21755 (plasmid) [Frondihabitans sp. PAMC 28766]|uniref:sigma-70 family RNA polymerase sigma factor n=1 Tax=Frondihabitans sp. PAMC 28766 TaxID=1795630 RepID=UPI00078DD592|nr:sigma-70 family RNA polymerase sigma factor [Frondihabitans sp. PAMC 28766]AMM22768.1 hypothetical protein AX769_21755 [Frondihabitans sp. PAMC 28766]
MAVVDTAGLLREIVAGDRAAFTVLYRHWSNRLRREVLRILRDPAQTDEVVQEIFLELWSHPGRFHPEKGPAGAFVLRLAKSRAIDRVRASQTHRDYTHLAGTHHHDPAGTTRRDTIDDWAVSYDLRRSLDTLTFLQREVLEMAYFQDLTQKDIADHLGVPIGTVKSRVTSALTALRKNHHAALDHP